MAQPAARRALGGEGGHRKGTQGREAAQPLAADRALAVDARAGARRQLDALLALWPRARQRRRGQPARPACLPARGLRQTAAPTAQAALPLRQRGSHRARGQPQLGRGPPLPELQRGARRVRLLVLAAAAALRARQRRLFEHGPHARLQRLQRGAQAAQAAQREQRPPLPRPRRLPRGAGRQRARLRHNPDAARQVPPAPGARGHALRLPHTDRRAGRVHARERPAPIGLGCQPVLPLHRWPAVPQLRLHKPKTLAHPVEPRGVRQLMQVLALRF
mmetsp:Transcript_20383/g.60101  ORF Transcript_20383/g.60101 Transcript_20383/m.60101 type:complete len:275 (+) Transcript_20383:360-1184(+)